MEPVNSELIDLRNVPLGTLSNGENRAVDAIVRRVIPSESAPRVAVASFQSAI